MSDSHQNHDSAKFEHFQDKYDAYILEDFRWTHHNYTDMALKPQLYSKWWSHVKGWRSLCTEDFKLQSVTEFIDICQNPRRISADICQNPSGISDLCQNPRRISADTLLEDIFNEVFKNIKNILQGSLVQISKEKQLVNSFIRYIIGQSIIFFKYEFFSSSMYYFNFIDNMLKSQEINIELINKIRAIYNVFLMELEAASLLTPDDVVNYKSICPIFDTMIIDYDHCDKNIILQDYVSEILS